LKYFEELKRRNVFRVAGVYAVAAWLLVQVVVAVEAPLSLPAWTDTLVIVLFGVGLPIALILAWAFEMTPEGMKLTANVAEGTSIAPKTGRKLDYAILGGVALVAAMFIYDRLTPEPFETAAARPPQGEEANPLHPEERAAGPRHEGQPEEGAQAPVTKDAPDASIAVLPFADLSPGKDQEYFSDGMAEEILNVLAKVDGLTVAARTSSFAFKGQETLGIPAIANELNVRHVLEGSVRKSGDTIRITAQLIDSARDAHLWSETFDRKLTAENIFALQDEIAGAIVGALRDKLKLTVGDTAPTQVKTGNVDAYELYLKARALFQARRNLNEADILLQNAIGIDPKFADALAIRAAIYQFGGEYGADLGDERAARATGRAFAEQALALNPDSSLALGITALGNFYDRLEGYGSVNYAEIFAGYDRALELDPTNANALNWQGVTYNYVGDYERAAAIHRRCVEIDPALAACASNQAVELASLGRLDEASAVIDAAIDGGAFAVGPAQMLLLAELKRRDAFLLLSLNLPALKGFRKFDALYEALSQPGGDDRALAAQLSALFAENKASRRVYTLLNALGDYSQTTLIVADGLDVMAGYRRSPEFKAHARASGVDVYWRAHGFPPRCKPIPAKNGGKDDFECQ